VTALFATYCSAEKRTDAGVLPAVQRYQSARIASVAERAAQQGARFAILSGSFGLIAPEHPLPFYDHLLTPDEVAAMVPRVAETLKSWAVSEVTWFTVSTAQDPNVMAYAAVMEGACIASKVHLSTVVIDIL